MLDLVVANAWLVDGTGNPGFRGHVGVKGGRIECVCRGLDPPPAGRIIDAAGKVLCPGFIDVHTHSDYSILHHRTALSSLGAGVTTEVMGMCGHTVFPVTPATAAQVRRSIGLFSGLDDAELPEISWSDLDQWLSTLEQVGVGINVAQMVGHGMLRTAAMGPEDGGGEVIVPSPSQLAEMQRMMTDAMEQGAFGLATGLGYPPGRNAFTDEVVSLATTASHYGGAYISHIRNEGEFLAWSTRELIEIAARSGIRASASHHKALGWENWGKVVHTLAMIESAQGEGVEVMVDFYPWPFAAQSNMGVMFYAGFDSPGRDRGRLLEVLADTQEFTALKRSLVEAWSKARDGARRRCEALGAMGVPVSTSVLGFDSSFLVHSEARAELVGMSLADICRQATGATNPEDMLDVLRDIYLADEGMAFIAGGEMAEDDLDALVLHPLAAVSTDGWTLSSALDLGHPVLQAHPRQYGTHARILEHYTLERGLISLEEAIRKMTSLPASLLGLDDRGGLKPGMWADLVILEPDSIANRASHAEPQLSPLGIGWVLVNGQVAIEAGKPLETLTGHVLRRR